MAESEELKLISESYSGPRFDKDNCVLQLMKREGEHLIVKQEVEIKGARKCSIAFSNDGKYLALFRKTRNILQIYKIDVPNDPKQIENLLNRVSEQDYYK